MTACPRDTLSEKVCVEEKNYFALSSQGRIKFLVPARRAHRTNQTKEGPLSFVLHKSPFASISTDKQGPPLSGLLRTIGQNRAMDFLRVSANHAVCLCINAMIFESIVSPTIRIL
jgi:hypothetical protein